MKRSIGGTTRLLLCAAVVLVLIPGVCLAEGQDDEATVARTLGDYFRAFGKLEAQAILPYYLEPSVLITPRGVVTMPTHAVVATTFEPLIEGLRKRGYARSEIIALETKLLSPTTMLASGVAVRYRSDGEELERAGVTYVLRKTGDGWKIVVTVAHDPGSVPRLE